MRVRYKVCLWHAAQASSALKVQKQLSNTVTGRDCTGARVGVGAARRAATPEGWAAGVAVAAGQPAAAGPAKVAAHRLEELQILRSI